MEDLQRKDLEEKERLQEEKVKLRQLSMEREIYMSAKEARLAAEQEVIRGFKRKGVIKRKLQRKKTERKRIKG